MPSENVGQIKVPHFLSPQVGKEEKEGKPTTQQSDGLVADSRYESLSGKKPPGADKASSRAPRVNISADNSQSALLNLPAGISEKILDRLDASSLANTSKVCHELKTAINANPTLHQKIAFFEIQKYFTMREENLGVLKKELRDLQLQQKDILHNNS